MRLLGCLQTERAIDGIFLWNMRFAPLHTCFRLGCPPQADSQRERNDVHAKTMLIYQQLG